MTQQPDDVQDRLDADDSQATDGAISRRGLLAKLGGAAVAGAGLAAAGTVVNPAPAEAATVFGDGGTSGDGIDGGTNSTIKSGVYGHNDSTGYGVFGSTVGAGIGVHGRAPGNGTGVQGFALGTGNGVYGRRGANPSGLGGAVLAGVVGDSNIGDGVAGVTSTQSAAGVLGATDLEAPSRGAGVKGTFGKIPDGRVASAGVWGISGTGDGVVGDSVEGHGVVGKSVNLGKSGVIGRSEQGDGVAGHAAGLNGYGLDVSNTGGGVAVRVIADPIQMWLVPASTPGAPGIGNFYLHRPGYLRVDRDANIWMCTEPGAPGTWKKVAYGGGGVTTVTPTRVCDTRSGTGPAGSPPNPLNAYSGTPVGAGQTLTIPLTDVIGPSGSTGTVIPATATGAILNVTVTNTTASSYLTVFPGNLAAPPTASNLNWTAGITIPNHVTVQLGPISGDATSRKGIKVFNSAGSVDVIVDVNGYIG